MSAKKISQIGATSKGRTFLRRLAGRSEKSGAAIDPVLGPKSPFKDMKDAYRTLFIYGLINGKRLPTEGDKFSTIYANVNMLTESFDYTTLLISMGKDGDLDDIGKSINEYTNWAIEDLNKRFPGDSFSVTELVKLFHDS